MKTPIDISIGPVQGFVSQSRRTRDLWGSSYLLAFLSAHAMLGAKSAGGKIVQPKVDDDQLFKWVSGEREGAPPRIGSLPNHFVVEADGDQRSIAAAAANALREAWEGVCSAVWSGYVEYAVSAGIGTKDIWDRQVKGFWEVMWTAGSASDGGGLLARRKRWRLLARRKRWRTHQVSDEPGDKCTLMHDLQELSGFVRAQERKQQDQFWDRIRSCTGELDLRDNERLCAIALVKRLFPREAKDALGWGVDASHWPSTVYVGAVPWIRRVNRVAPEKAREYADKVRNAVRNATSKAFPMQSPPFNNLLAAEAGEFPKLDANYMHLDFVSSERLSPLKEADRKELTESLKCLYKAEDSNGQPLGAPPVFYALLLADGDRLGELVFEKGGGVVGEALASFTCNVPKITKKHDGVTIYAGGDDVLAMLPVSDALACANELSGAYEEAFSNSCARGKATLSAAVVFAHMRLPLSAALREAHHLLDDIAKDGNGRNSVAATVLKPAGKHCQWVTAWTRCGPSGEVRAVDLLDQIASDLGGSAADPGLSSSLIYRIRETLSMLCGWDSWEPGEWGVVPGDIDLEPFLRAEIYRSLDIRSDGCAGDRSKSLASRVSSLLSLASNSPPSESDDDGMEKVGVDALLLAQFLSGPEDSEAYR